MGKQVTEMLKGTLEGIVLAILSGRSGVRLRDHGLAAGAGLLRHRRGHRLRAAHQDRAARPRRRGEGPVREGAAAQGVLAQRSGTGLPRRVLEDVELPRGTARTAPRRRQIDMAAQWIELVTGCSSRRSSTGSTRRASRLCREPYRTARRRWSGTSCTTWAPPDGDGRPHDDGRLRRPLGACRGGRHAGARDRRGGPGRVRRDVRPGLRRQAVDRQGARPPDQGDRGRRSEDGRQT